MAFYLHQLPSNRGSFWAPSSRMANASSNPSSPLSDLYNVTPGFSRRQSPRASLDPMDGIRVTPGYSTRPGTRAAFDPMDGIRVTDGYSTRPSTRASIDPMDGIRVNPLDRRPCALSRGVRGFGGQVGGGVRDFGHRVGGYMDRIESWGGPDRAMDRMGGLARSAARGYGDLFQGRSVMTHGWGFQPGPGQRRPY